MLVHKDHNQQAAKRIFAKQSAPQDLFTVTVLLFLQAGSGQNFLFLYRGSWLVAADPLSNSLTYRMFQRSGAARTPDTRADTWHVVNNDGTISQTSQARVLPTAFCEFSLKDVKLRCRCGRCSKPTRPATP